MWADRDACWVRCKKCGRRTRVEMDTNLEAAMEEAAAAWNKQEYADFTK